MPRTAIIVFHISGLQLGIKNPLKTSYIFGFVRIDATKKDILITKTAIPKIFLINLLLSLIIIIIMIRDIKKMIISGGN